MNAPRCQIPRVSDEAFKRYLRFPVKRPLEGPMAERAAWARDWYQQNGRPWIVQIPVEVTVVENKHLLVAGQAMGDPRVARLFHRIREGRLVAASAGAEAEAEALRLWQRDEPDSYYFLDAFAAAVANQLLVDTRSQLQEQTTDGFWTPHRCPGYGAWDIVDNLDLFAILQSRTELPGPLQVLNSGMLKPTKSLIGILGQVPATPSP